MSSEILQSLAQSSQKVPVTSLFTRKELVGKGAYGGVYKGVHVNTGLVVALKIIDLDTPDDDISEIQREVALLSEMRDTIRHNITSYYGCYLHGHELWIAMDFASGGSIRTLMKSGMIEEKYIVLILREVLVALSYLHHQGIIHRDVKAANILLTQVGKILLADFGVSAHLQTNNKRSTFIGTPLWMAPEVITDGKLYDTKADIWSLGITMYEIATGNPPYFGMEPLRACALIPRTAPAKLEGGNWSPAMREFLGLCLQVDPTNRPTADELSKTKWIKAASKLSMSLLKELIVKYVSWIQTGGQRASLAGLDALTREDTFEIEDDHWDFDTNGPDMNVEPLGDEPVRTLDDKAAISNLRPPKYNNARNHPLLRLFDAESNPYAQATPSNTYIQLPSGAASMDTVRPMISIPSFEEMDEMAEAKSTKFIELPDDLMTPATIKPNPFSWTTQTPQAHQPPPSPFLPASPRMRSHTPDSGWGHSVSQNTTPTDAYFPSDVQSFGPVSSSPSLPSLNPDRPFTQQRRRADTAPSFEYPPLGPGIPSPLPTPSHSTNTSISSALSMTGSSASSATSYTPYNESPPTGPRPGMPRTKSNFDGIPDANRPFRERKASDAAIRPLRMATVDGGGRPRTPSDARPNGIHPKHGMKLQISTGVPGSISSSSPTSYLGHRSTGSGAFSYATPPSSAAFASNMRHNVPPPLATAPAEAHSSLELTGFPFPSGPIDISDEAPPATMIGNGSKEPYDWPSGPPIRPLDYEALVTTKEIHFELEKTIDELGKWLEVVDGGLERILDGTA